MVVAASLAVECNIFIEEKEIQQGFSSFLHSLKIPKANYLVASRYRICDGDPFQSSAINNHDREPRRIAIL